MKRFVCLALLALICLTGFAIAQETRSTISGTVTDQTGAAIPSAKIAVTEIRTGVRTPSSTDATGSYSIPFLPPGQYELTADAPGFRPYLRKGLTLGASDHAVIDVQLAIGQASETVEVTADAPMLETANSSTGQSITTKQIEDFPLNGRNPMVVAELAMGVVATGNPSTPISPFANAAASGWSIGGTPSQTSEIMIDGAPNATWDGRVAYSPPQEAVQEVKVKAFDGDAGFGHTGGGTINKVMKTGTNTLHGSGYYFMQPSDLAANNFFNNRATPIIPVQATKFNQYGVTAGGPMIIPKVFNGKNKLFWFFAFERIKGSQPNTKFLTVPTDAERKGDFSSLLALGSNYQIYNPYSAVADSKGVITRKPFYCDVGGNPISPNAAGIQATGTACNKLPAQLMNPVALAYLGFYPGSNNAAARSDGYGNYANSNTTDDNFNNELGRLDWAMSDRSRLSFNIRRTGYLQSKNDYFGNKAAGLASNLTRDNWGATVDEVFTINTTTMLNVRGNFTQMRETHPSPMAGFDPTTLGFPGYIKANSTFTQLPRISFGSTCGSDTTQASSFDCIGQTGADMLPSNSYSLFGTLVKQWRQHTFKWGVDARRYTLDAQTYGNSVGSYTFGTGWTQLASNSAAAPFGQDFASFLLGLPTSGQIDINARGTYISYYNAIFMQDDWRVTPTVTLNFGLRWDHDSPYAEKIGRTVNGFAFSTLNPISAAATTAYTAKTLAKMPTTINGVAVPTSFAVPGGLNFATPQNGNVYDISSKMLSPRLGFAWSPEVFHNKTVIRGGFGVFVQSIAMANLNPVGTYSSTPILTQEGFSQTTQFPIPGTLLTPLATLSNPFPNGILPPAGSAAGLQTFLGQNVDFFNPQMQNPYSERWTFGVQHQLTPNTVLEVAYIGNHALHLPMSVTQLNGIPRKYLSTSSARDAALITTLTASVPNPMAGLIPSLGSSGLNGTNTTVRQLLAPYPAFPVADSTAFSSGVTERNGNFGSSYYNSLNVRIEKRLSKGLNLIATYGWSKLIERDSWLNNTDPVPEKRISPFDRPQRFVTAVNYDLPIGRGKLINLENSWLDRFAGGWRVNGIYTFQSGAPILWMNGSTNNPGDYPLCSTSTVSGLCPAASATAWVNPSDLNLNSRGVDGKAFDTTRFVTSSSGQFQFHLRTMPSTFGNLRADGQNNFDASILKKFTVTERQYFQFRMEAFNVLNHPMFAAPNVQVTSSSFGIINTQANRPRAIQFGFRYVF